MDYEPIWNSAKTEIVGYAAIRVNKGRRISPKPTLDGLDGDYDHDSNYRDPMDYDD